MAYSAASVSNINTCRCTTSVSNSQTYVGIGPLSIAEGERSDPLLCQYCQEFDLDDLAYEPTERERVEDIINPFARRHKGKALHHSSYFDLYDSAKAGCVLCAAILEARVYFPWQLPKQPDRNLDGSQIYCYSPELVRGDLLSTMQWVQCDRSPHYETKFWASLSTFTTKGMLS